ncbi:MAG: SH3 domain-containing protein [Muribaculaceae bacterium]|nr:SH3 domain-containing protein [Muribaculaceae bacterium]
MKQLLLALALVLGTMVCNAQLGVFVSDDTQPTNLRDAPKGNIVDYLRNGDMIDVDRCVNGWFHIVGRTYVDGNMGETAKFRSRGELWIHRSVVGVDWVNDGDIKFTLRATPSTNGKAVHSGNGTRNNNSISQLLDLKGGWAKVKLDNGHEGWVKIGMLCGNSLTVCCR